MFLKQKTFQPYSWSFKIFPLPPLLPQFPLICLFCHCMHRAASLAVLHLHCWLPEGQIPSGVASCAVLSLRPWDILGEMKNPLVTVVTSSPPLLLPSLVSFSSSVLLGQLFEVNVPKAAGDHHDSLGTDFLLRGCCLMMTSAMDEVFARFKCVCHPQVWCYLHRESEVKMEYVQEGASKIWNLCYTEMCLTPRTEIWYFRKGSDCHSSDKIR